MWLGDPVIKEGCATKLLPRSFTGFFLFDFGTCLGCPVGASANGFDAAKLPEILVDAAVAGLLVDAYLPFPFAEAGVLVVFAACSPPSLTVICPR